MRARNSSLPAGKSTRTPRCPGRDALGALADEPQRRRDAPREVEREPHRSEQDEERGKEVEGAVEREDRLAVGLRLAELRVAVLHLVDGRRDLRGHEARDHDRPRGRAVRRAHGHRDAREAARPERHVRLGLAAGRGGVGERLARGGVPGGRGRQARVHHRDELGPVGVDGDEVELALARAGLDGAAQAALFVGHEPAGLDLAGEEARLDAARRRRGGVERGTERLRRGEQPLDVDVEPAVDGLPDEVAADEQQQDRRRHRHQQEDEQELDPQARAEDAAPPLHQHPDEVAAEDEDEDEQQRQVEDRQPVEQRRGEEVGLEVAALAQEPLGQEEDEQQPAGHGEHEPDVVLERLPRHRQSVAPEPHPANPSTTMALLCRVQPIYGDAGSACGCRSPGRQQTSAQLGDRRDDRRVRWTNGTRTTGLSDGADNNGRGSKQRKRSGSDLDLASTRSERSRCPSRSDPGTSPSLRAAP